MLTGVRFNPKGTIAARFPFHVMVQHMIEKKNQSAKELSKLSQGEV